MSVQNKTMLALLFVVSLAFSVKAEVFDISKYGSKADGASDSSQGLETAWKAACASTTPTEVLIPKGNFLVKNAKLEGPCKAPIRINLQGTLLAPQDHTKQGKDEWISIYMVEGFTLYGGGVIDGQGKATWAKKLAKQVSFKLPTALGLSSLTNAYVKDITVKDSKMFQINVYACKNITLQRVTVSAPYDSPNTDGIHIGRSTGVRVLHSHIHTGDDCVSIGDGCQNIKVHKVRCGPGHGIAVGSLGLYENEEPVTGIYVSNCTLTNTENGLRIKTWEDSKVQYVASDIHFKNIILNNVTYPINIDQEYCPSGNCPKVQNPSKIQISKLSFKGIRGTSASSQIVKIVCSKSRPCSGVELSDINIKYNGPPGLPTSVCANVNPKITGTQEPKLCTSKPLLS